MNLVYAGDVPVLPVTLLVALIVGAAAVLWSDGRHTVAPTTAARRAVRHATLTAVIAVVPLVLGVVYPYVAITTGYPFRLDTRVDVAVPIGSLWLFLAVYACGELTWPRPHDTHRRARLTARTTADITDARARRRLWITTAALAATCIALMLAADGPDSIARVEGGAVERETIFPGWLWCAPILLASLVAVALAETVLRLIAVRPAVVDVDEAWDMWLRRRAARRILRAVQLVTGLTLAGLLLVAAVALRMLGQGTVGTAELPVLPEYVTGGTIAFWAAMVAALATVLATCRRAHDPMPDPTPARVTAEARA